MSGTLIIFFKELKDILRDRRTIISMVLVPMLFYPIMSIGLGSLISSQVEKTRAERQPIMILPSHAEPGLMVSLAADTSLRLVPSDSILKLLLQQAENDTTLDKTLIRRIFSSLPSAIPDSIKQPIYYAAVAQKWIRAVAELPESLPSSAGPDSVIVGVYTDQAEIKSDAAGDHIRERMRTVNDSLTDRRLAPFGVSQRSLRPFWIGSADIAPKSKQAGRFLAILLPYMLMILTFTGGMYPALDITAGEKERNTLETLLVAPVSRWQIALGKFLTVMTAGFVTMLLATASMTFSMKWGAMQFSDQGAQSLPMGMSGTAVGWILLLMIPTSTLFSSLLVVVSISARSYKEAQSYATPLLMMIILPAMVSFVPGIELNWSLAFVPVVNLSLALKDVILGVEKPLQILLVFAATAVYASFMLFVTARIFQRESVLFRT